MVEVQRAHLLTVAQLNLEFERGSITYGEYIARLEQLNATTRLLDAALGSNSRSIDAATTSLISNNQELSRNIQLTRQATAATNANTDSLVRNRGEAVESSRSVSGPNAGAAALISEIGLDEYNRLLRGTIRYGGASGYQVDRLAQRRLQEQRDLALRRARGGDTSGIDGITSTNPRDASAGSLGNIGSGGANFTRESVNVNITLPSGSTTSVSVSSQGDADSLVQALSSLGETNINGIS